MDSSGEVVKASDGVVEEKKRSRYVDAYLNGRAIKSAMKADVFEDFLDYGELIAKQGAEEIFSGNILPSPYGKACEFCEYGGMCGFSSETDDVRKVCKMSGEDIAAVVRKVKGGENE